MNSRTIPPRLAAAALWSALAACASLPPAPQGSNESPEQRASSPQPAEVIAEYQESIHAGLPEFSFTLKGERPSAEFAPARIQIVEIRRRGEPKASQVIDGIAAEAPLERPGAFEVLDMNFDGYGDIRLIEYLPAGPNIPYRNWLFDNRTGKFEPSPELDKISSAVFDAASKKIRSPWRDGAAHYGEDTYQYVNGEPVLIRRDERRYTEPGVYRLTVSERVDGGWKTVESKDVRE